MGKKTTAESGRSGHGVRSEYTIKRVRRFPRKGDDVFRLTLCRNNTPVAYVTGFGRGVGITFRWEDTESPRINISWKDSNGFIRRKNCTPEELAVWKTFESPTDTYDTFILDLLDEYVRRRNQRWWRRLWR